MERKIVRAVLPGYEEIKGRVFCRFLPGGTDKAARGGLVTREWKDLFLCPYVDLSEQDGPEIYMSVRDICLRRWEISEEEVFRQAWANTCDRKLVFFSGLEELLAESGESGGCREAGAESEGAGLYILSNTRRVYGAVSMAVPALLSEVGQTLGKDYYVLPSSIHEVLILPDTGGFGPDELNDLVSTINRNCVSEEEKLADHVYYYRRETEELLGC